MIIKGCSLHQSTHSVACYAEVGPFKNHKIMRSQITNKALSVVFTRNDYQDRRTEMGNAFDLFLV